MVTDKLGGRQYDDACAAAHALNLLGERWSMLVVRELLFGPKRFSDLSSSLPDISAKVLSQRLESLEALDIVEKVRLPPPTSVQVYQLTEWGYEAEPIFQSLGRWAARSKHHDPSKPISAVSLLMSFRTMFDRNRLKGRTFEVEFRMGRETFVGTVAPSGFKVERRGSEDPAVVLTGTPSALAAVIYGGAPDSMISVEGDTALFALFRTLFPLPPKAS